MKKILFGLTIISTFILILIVSLAYFGVLEYKINPLQMAEPSDTNSQFTISRQLADTLNQKYLFSDKEFSVCLKAEQKLTYSEDRMKAEMTYVLVDIDGDINYAGLDYSLNEYCEQGVIHSHPKGSSFFSLADITAFKDRIKQGEIFSVVMYGEDKFAYVTRNDFLERQVKVTN